MTLLKQSRKLILTALLLSLTTLSACNKETKALGTEGPNKPVSGPSETGGGDATKMNLVGMEKELESTIHNYHSNIASLIWEYSSGATALTAFESDQVNKSDFFELLKKVKPELAKLFNFDIMRAVAKKLKNGKLLFEAAKKLDTPLVLDGEGCVDHSGKEREASSAYKNRLCFSVSKMAQTTNFSNVNKVVKSMLMHELGHKAGLSELEAQHLEIMFWFFDSTKIWEHTNISIETGLWNFVIRKGYVSNLLIESNNFRMDQESVIESYKLNPMYKAILLTDYFKSNYQSEYYLEKSPKKKTKIELIGLFIRSWKKHLNHESVRELGVSYTELAEYSFARLTNDIESLNRLSDNIPNIYKVHLREVFISFQKLNSSMEKLTRSFGRSKASELKDITNVLNTGLSRELQNASDTYVMDKKIIEKVSAAIFIFTKISGLYVYGDRYNSEQDFVNRSGNYDICAFMKSSDNDFLKNNACFGYDNIYIKTRGTELEKIESYEETIIKIVDVMAISFTEIEKRNSLSRTYSCQFDETICSDLDENLQEIHRNEAKKFFKDKSPSYLKAIEEWKAKQ